MPFVQAKCPECGGMLAVESDKKAAVCQFCGEAFIVQEAINNYVTYNETINNYNTSHNYGEGVVINQFEGSNNAERFLKRANIFIHDKDYEKAREYFDKYLDYEPEDANAYLGVLFTELQINSINDLYNIDKELSEDYYFNKAVKYADSELRKKLIKAQQIITVNKCLRRAECYYEHNQYSDSIDTYNKVLSIEPQNAEATEKLKSLFLEIEEYIVPKRIFDKVDLHESNGEHLKAIRELNIYLNVGFAKSKTILEKYYSNK